MVPELKNKPLAEALFEIHWKLQGPPQGPQRDPHYKLLLARLFDRLASLYPEHEQLPAASIPDELLAHVVQHRFRVGAGKWPLVQVGPGVLTVNSTADYKWEDFRPRTLKAVKTLFEVHPKVEEFAITKLQLRYIDAVEFDYSRENVLDFLKDKMKVNYSTPSNLFEDSGVRPIPSNLTLQSAFRCERPSGMINLRFATGQKRNRPAIVWETTLESRGHDIPSMPAEFESWLESAHSLTDSWFFTLIQGELEKAFS